MVWSWVAGKQGAYYGLQVLCSRQGNEVVVVVLCCGGGEAWHGRARQAPETPGQPMAARSRTQAQGPKEPDRAPKLAISQCRVDLPLRC